MQALNIQRRSALALAMSLIGTAAAQSPPAIIPDTNQVMGFETPTAWSVIGGTASSTTTRTEGKAAYALSNPPGTATLTSAPVASTSKAVTGIGNSGALF